MENFNIASCFNEINITFFKLNALALMRFILQSYANKKNYYYYLKYLVRNGYFQIV